MQGGQPLPVLRGPNSASGETAAEPKCPGPIPPGDGRWISNTNHATVAIGSHTIPRYSDMGELAAKLLWTELTQHSYFGTEMTQRSYFGQNWRSIATLGQN